MLCFRILTASMLVCLGINLTGEAQEARQAPPGLFKWSASLEMIQEL